MHCDSAGTCSSHPLSGIAGDLLALLVPRQSSQSSNAFETGQPKRRNRQRKSVSNTAFRNKHTPPRLRFHQRRLRLLCPEDRTQLLLRVLGAAPVRQACSRSLSRRPALALTPRPNIARRHTLGSLACSIFATWDSRHTDAGILQYRGATGPRLAATGDRELRRRSGRGPAGRQQRRQYPLGDTTGHHHCDGLGPHGDCEIARN